MSWISLLYSFTSFVFSLHFTRFFLILDFSPFIFAVFFYFKCFDYSMLFIDLHPSNSLQYWLYITFWNSLFRLSFFLIQITNIEYNFKWNQPYLSRVSNLSLGSNSLNLASEKTVEYIFIISLLRSFVRKWIPPLIR